MRLRVLVDERGAVLRASVVSESDPGYGFGQAAIRIAKRHLRFRPARRGGDAIAAETLHTLTFRLQ